MTNASEQLLERIAELESENGRLAGELADAESERDDACGDAESAEDDANGLRDECDDLQAKIEEARNYVAKIENVNSDPLVDALAKELWQLLTEK